MFTDLMVYIVKRSAKVPYKQEPRNVRPVSKDAKFRPLNDEEKQLQLLKGKKEIRQLDHPFGLYKDSEGNKHFDDFV